MNEMKTLSSEAKDRMRAVPARYITDQEAFELLDCDPMRCRGGGKSGIENEIEQIRRKNLK